MIFSRGKIRVVFLLVLITAPIISVYARKKVVEPKRDAKTTYLMLEAANLTEFGDSESNVLAYDILSRVIENDSANADALFALAPLQLGLERYQEGYNYLKRAAEADTSNHFYSNVAANIMAEVGEYEQAEKIYNSLIKSAPDDEDLYFNLAEIYLRSGNIEKAMACYDSVESMTENMEMIAMLKSSIFQKLRRYNDAISEIKRLLEKYPDDIHYMLTLSDYYLAADSVNASKKLIDKAKEFGAGCTIAVSEAAYYDKKGNMDSLRLSIYNALECPEITLDAKQGMLKDYLTLILNREKNVEVLQQADTLFMYLTEAYPREASIKNFYANVLIARKMYMPAIEQLKGSIYINPYDMSVHKQLIGVLYESGNKEAMKKAVDEAKKYADSTFVIDAATAYFLAGMSDYAKRELNAALVKNNNSPMLLSEIHLLLADIYNKEGNLEMAFANYEMSLKYNPNNIMAMNNYAYNIATSGGDLEKAEQMSAKTIKSKPNDPTYLDTYGWIFFKKKNYLFAELYLKRALDNGGDENGEVLEHYGDVLFMQGKKNEALEYWKKAEKTGNAGDKLNLKIKNGTYVE